MNDDFLTRFRKPPRREFSAALYQRINAPMNTRSTFSRRKWSLAAALCLALIAAVAFSPAARAAITSLIRQIGEITYVGPDENPLPPVPEDQVTLVPEETLPIDEARAKVPFEIKLPDWAPDGYTMSTMARISYFPSAQYGTAPFVYLTWEGSQADAGGPPVIIIELVISPKVQWLVDLDHLQEVQVNGQSAGLTGGTWNADTGEWDNTSSDLTLTWMIGDTMYQLRSPDAAVEDLIRMAESIH